ncbi:hypothetical protein HMPREF3180_00238 [Leptotrichia wadei]|uniref:Uncharacterized protein n=1 Tax=Leptotrichia wadei TaxID=157687 RepID=A0A134AQ44_9FUSO|nr:hypothetical protein HMPREF3180_00238 [Leptotrichia wadei]
MKIKIAGAGIIGQALKCFKNGHTRKEKGQGNMARLWVKTCEKTSVTHKNRLLNFFQMKKALLFFQGL